MNTSPSSPVSPGSTSILKLPMRWWRRLQVWRGMRLLRIAEWHVRRSMKLRLKAVRLIGRNAQAPCPLFDNDHEGKAK
jgi:hypothetical protein